MPGASTITGYRITDLDDVQAPLSGLATGYTEWELPLGPVAGAYTNLRLRGDRLVQWLQDVVGGPASQAASNSRRGGPFYVTYRDSAQPGYVAGNSTLASILAANICIGARAYAEQSPDGPNSEYVASYDPTGPLATNKDGFFGPDTGIPARWVLVDSEAAASANIPVIDTRTNWRLNQTGKTLIGGVYYYFGTNASGGPYAAPTTVMGTPDWHAEAPPLAPNQFYQVISVALAQAIAMADTAIQPITYRIVRGSTGSPAARRGDVVVQGIAYSPATSPSEGDIPARFATIGLWLNPTSGQWVQAFYDVATDTVTPTQFEARAANVAVKLLNGFIGFETLDQALVRTNPRGVSMQLNTAAAAITANTISASRWPSFFDAAGASIFVSDGITVRLSDSSIVDLVVQNAFFFRQAGSTAATAKLQTPGLLSSQPPRDANACGQFINSYSEIPLELQGDDVCLINGNYVSVIGTGRLFLYGSVLVGTIASGVTVVDRRPNQRIVTANDIEITDATKGVIQHSPNGSRWRITVDDSGNLSTNPA